MKKDDIADLSALPLNSSSSTDLVHQGDQPAADVVKDLGGAGRRHLLRLLPLLRPLLPPPLLAALLHFGHGVHQLLVHDGRLLLEVLGPPLGPLLQNCVEVRQFTLLVLVFLMLAKIDHFCEN